MPTSHPHASNDPPPAEPAKEPVPLDRLEKALCTTRGWLDELVSPYAVKAHREKPPADGNAA